MVADLLTGSDAGELLATAVSASGGELDRWCRDQVHLRANGTTVAFRAWVRWRDGPREETFVARAGAGLPETPGVLRLTDGAAEVAVWRLSDDPWLPGVASALDPAALAELLRSSGVRAVDVRTRLRSYRPGRRAVVEVRAEGVRFVVKVLRPDRVESLHRRHALLADAGVPVPRSLGWSTDGLLLMTWLPGETLRRQIRRGGPTALGGRDLVDLLDRLPAAATRLPRRPSWSEQAHHYAEVVSAALPAAAGRARELTGRIAAGLRACSSGPTQPVHGDLYEAQVLVDGDTISGLLDVDTLGPGHRSDDLACAAAHLSVLAQVWPHRAALLAELQARWLSDFDRACDPYDLRVRAAGVALSLATGPYRVQDPDWPATTVRRLDLVEAWLDDADRLAGASVRTPERTRARAHHPMSELSSRSRSGLTGPAKSGCSDGKPAVPGEGAPS
jgi:Ser/Thr protein kinase RdoA (MazF antagonist)